MKLSELPIGHTFEFTNAPGVWFKKTGEKTYTDDGEFIKNVHDYNTNGNDYDINEIGNEEPTVDLVEVPLITDLATKPDNLFDHQWRVIKTLENRR